MLLERVVIFCIYDFEGILDDYREYMLQAFQKISDRIIVIINGSLNKESKQKILYYTKEIIVRENKGFDVGAYKEIIVNYLGRDALKKLDELLLVNDTFFGPFYGFKPIIDNMRDVECDFWGITEVGGNWNNKWYPKRLQSYFAMYRKKVLQDSAFFDFFVETELPDSYYDAVERFEVGLYQKLKNSGFSDKVYTEIYGKEAKIGFNPYGAKPYELISEASCPLVRKKSFYRYNGKEDCYKQKILAWIEDNTDYNIDWIKRNLARIYAANIDAIINVKRLRNFINKHKRIYVYGNGVVGKLIQKNLKDQRINFDGILVTQLKSSEEGSLIEEFSPNKIQEGDGIIIGTGKVHEQEIYDLLHFYLADEDILKV